jgi:hypothetical protein
MCKTIIQRPTHVGQHWVRLVSQQNTKKFREKMKIQEFGAVPGILREKSTTALSECLK